MYRIWSGSEYLNFVSFAYAPVASIHLQHGANDSSCSLGRNRIGYPRTTDEHGAMAAAARMARSAFQIPKKGTRVCGDQVDVPGETFELRNGLVSQYAYERYSLILTFNLTL